MSNHVAARSLPNSSLHIWRSNCPRQILPIQLRPVGLDQRDAHKEAKFSVRVDDARYPDRAVLANHHVTTLRRCPPSILFVGVLANELCTGEIDGTANDI